MSEFPKLRTGAPAQYPATKCIEYRTTVLKFLDGTEQRYRESGSPLRRWELSFRLVDEDEAGRMQELFEVSNGRFGSFEFEDPWEGMKKRECSFAEDEMEWKLDGEFRSEGTIVIRETNS